MEELPHPNEENKVCVSESLLQDKNKLKKLFRQAVKFVQTAEENSHITNEEKLRFYGLYKQATLGQCSSKFISLIKEKRPSILKLIERMKHDAWVRYGGNISKEQAMLKYIQNLEKVQSNWNTGPKI